MIHFAELSTTEFKHFINQYIKQLWKGDGCAKDLQTGFYRGKTSVISVAIGKRCRN